MSYRFCVLLWGASIALLSACAPGPHGAKPEAIPVPLPAAVPTDASYDWHVLLPAAFGSALKEVPLNLHEVLLFRDEEHHAPPGDDSECYASDASPPRFIGRVTSEYLVCFKQDRLSRIEASVPAAAVDAPQVFAAACTLWLKNAADSGAAAPGAVPPIPTSATECEGRDGAIHFSGRLAEEPDAADSTLSIVLDSPPDRQ